MGRSREIDQRTGHGLWSSGGPWWSLVVLGGPPCGVRGEVGIETQVVCMEVGTGVEEWKVRITTLSGGFLWRGWGDLVLEGDEDRRKHLQK